MILEVNYKHTSNAYLAAQWLRDLPDIVGLDFECASRTTDIEKELLVRQDVSDVENVLNSDGLSHPSLALVTHLSIGLSPTEGRVIICDSDNIRKLVFNFLVTTEILQVWCNVLFDFKHILYNTGSIPKNWYDIQLAAKCRLNHADSSKCLVSLKQLQGHNYGAWAIAKELEFNQKNMYDPVMLKYAAIDGCATINEYLYHNDDYIDMSSICI